MLLSERRQRYRRVLAGDACVYPASVFDPMSARMAESLGYEVGMLAGSIASATVLGAPDLVVLTLTEFAEQIRRITRAGTLSLMVDADHGYGNALNVMRTVEELETAGVAALTIEDTLLPTAFGGEGEGLISIPEMIGKLRAAVAARQDPSLVVIGRTSALRHGGIDETVRRLQAYETTGVDAFFVVGARERAEIEAIHAATALPLMLGGSPAAPLVRLAFPERPPRAHRPARPRAVLCRGASRVRRAQAPQGGRHPRRPQYAGRRRRRAGDGAPAGCLCRLAGCVLALVTLRTGHAWERGHLARGGLRFPSPLVGEGRERGEVGQGDPNFVSRHAQAVGDRLVCLERRKGLQRMASACIPLSLTPPPRSGGRELGAS